MQRRQSVRYGNRTPPPCRRQETKGLRARATRPAHKPFPTRHAPRRPSLLSKPPSKPSIRRRARTATHLPASHGRAQTPDPVNFSSRRSNGQSPARRVPTRCISAVHVPPTFAGGRWASTRGPREGRRDLTLHRDPTAGAAPRLRPPGVTFIFKRVKQLRLTFGTSPHEV